MSEAIALQRKDREALIAENRPGLAAKEALQKEDFKRLKTAVGALIGGRGAFIKAGQDFSYVTDGRKRHVINDIVEKAQRDCPDEIRDAEVARAMLTKFFETFFKIFM